MSLDTFIATDGTTPGNSVNSCNVVIPYQITYPPVTYHCGCCRVTVETTNKLGEFDLHLDRTGNLRVMHNGKLLATFDPEDKKRR